MGIRMKMDEIGGIVIDLDPPPGIPYYIHDLLLPVNEKRHLDCMIYNLPSALKLHHLWFLHAEAVQPTLRTPPAFVTKG
jgi:hypothetical protein